MRKYKWEIIALPVLIVISFLMLRYHLWQIEPYPYVGDENWASKPYVEHALSGRVVLLYKYTLPFAFIYWATFLFITHMIRKKDFRVIPAIILFLPLLIIVDPFTFPLWIAIFLLLYGAIMICIVLYRFMKSTVRHVKYDLIIDSLMLPYAVLYFIFILIWSYEWYSVFGD